MRLHAAVHLVAAVAAVACASSSREASRDTSGVADAATDRRVDQSAEGSPGDSSPAPVSSDAAAITDAAVADGRVVQDTGATSDDAGVDSLPPCPGTPVAPPFSILAARQRGAGALQASSRGLAWSLPSFSYGLCNIRFCDGTTDAAIASLPAGTALPVTLWTGYSPRIALADLSDSMAFLISPTPAGLATGPATLGLAPWGGGTIRQASLQYASGLVADGADIFVADSPSLGAFIRKIPVVSLEDPSTWASSELLPASVESAALDASAYWAGTINGIARIDRSTLEVTWPVPPSIAGDAAVGYTYPSTVWSLAVDATHAYYVAGEYSITPRSQFRVARLRLDGSSSEEIVADVQLDARAVELIDAHVYWIASLSGDGGEECTAIVRSPKDGGESEVVFATTDVLQDLAVNQGVLYLTTLGFPRPFSTPAEAPPARGIVARLDAPL